MGDLARRRGARDIWVSRGQLWAVGASVAFLAVCCFGLGVAWGTDSRDAIDESSGFRSEIPSESLVDLLARVEAGTDPMGAVGRLTFPEELAAATPALEVPVEESAPSAAVDIETEGSARDAAPLPDGAYTVELARFTSESEAGSYRVSLLEQGLEVDLVTEHIGGVPSFRLVSGSFSDERSASQHAATVSGPAATLGFDPVITPVR